MESDPEVMPSISVSKSSDNDENRRIMTSIPGREVLVHGGLKLFLDMGVGIGGDKWPAADLVSFTLQLLYAKLLYYRT